MVLQLLGKEMTVRKLKSYLFKTFSDVCKKDQMSDMNRHFKYSKIKTVSIHDQTSGKSEPDVCDGSQTSVYEKCLDVWLVHFKKHSKA